MDADWYEDPLGRFDGRYFDGAAWTNRVSDGGVLRDDPDFVDAEKRLGDTSSEDVFDDRTTPAVQSISRSVQRRASMQAESPTRVVAVLDDLAPPDTSTPRPWLRWLIAAVLAAVAISALLGLAARNGPAGDVVAENRADLDAQLEERVQDLEQGGIESGNAQSETAEVLDVDVPDQTVDPTADFSPDEWTPVGPLTVVNGASLLAELAEWHQTFAIDRGVDLAPGAGCWFGQLGGAAVQAAHCGPVGGEDAADLRFDVVPLAFDDVTDGQVAQPLVDAVTIDAVIANTLELLAAPGGTPPPR